jgi:hypothetical protein
MGLNPKEIPQIVFLTFYDALNYCGCILRTKKYSETEPIPTVGYSFHELEILV